MEIIGNITVIREIKDAIVQGDLINLFFNLVTFFIEEIRKKFDVIWKKRAKFIAGWKVFVSLNNNEKLSELVVGMKSTAMIMIEVRVDIVSNNDHKPQVHSNSFLFLREGKVNISSQINDNKWTTKRL